MDREWRGIHQGEGWPGQLLPRQEKMRAASGRGRESDVWARSRVLGEEGAVSDLGSRERESQALGTDFSWWKLSGPGPVVGVPGGSLQGLGGEGGVGSGGKRPPPYSRGWGPQDETQT